jgi:hypothetical protein
MWGSEKGLGYWLRHGSPEKRRGVLRRIMKSILRWIGFAKPSPRVRELPLRLNQSLVPSWTLDVSQNVCIHDGLAGMPSLTPGNSNQDRHFPEAGVMDLKLDGQEYPDVSDLELSNRAPVCNFRLLDTSTLRSLRLMLQQSSVRTLHMISPDTTAVQTGRHWLFRRRVTTRTDTLRLMKAPHLRWSRDLSNLHVREMEGFLREGTRLRGIRQGDGEILAVFARVPIELVADYRYIQEKQLLLYSIALDKRSFTTRIHDLAAIREKASGKTYMVADPNRFQTTLLN